MEFKTDIQIAQECRLQPMTAIADRLGIKDEHLEQYGRHKAKIDYKLLTDMKNEPDGKLILVTAIIPTPAGKGKTTTSVCLAGVVVHLCEQPNNFSYSYGLDSSIEEKLSGICRRIYHADGVQLVGNSGLF